MITHKEAISLLDKSYIPEHLNGFLELDFEDASKIIELLKSEMWHKYPDEKPEKNGRYLVKQRMDEETYMFDYKNNSTSWEQCGIVAWRKIPKYEEE